MSHDLSQTPVSSELGRRLLALLHSKGGHAGNKTLQRELNWDSDTYWTIRDRLVDDGQLELGRGKGGSVSVVAQLGDAAVADVVAVLAAAKVAECDLYSPLARVLQCEWSKDMRFRSSAVEVTARQGRRDTGGTWTRPDIVVAALRTFPYVPGKFFDLVTFEVKALDGIDVTAVFEALAHRRAATQAYVWLHVPAGLELREEVGSLLARINEEARRHGVGLIIGSDPADYSSWDMQLKAVRMDPDPESLNEFIAQQLSQRSREELAQWLR